MKGQEQIGSGHTRIRRGPAVRQGHVAPRRATEPDRILLTAGHQPITHCMPLARRTRIEAGMFVVRALYVQLACVLHRKKNLYVFFFLKYICVI